jgi:hypothetical protein
MKIEVMAKFVAKRAEECPERCHVFSNRRPHPHADRHRIGVIISKQLTRRMLAHPQRPRRQHAHPAPRHLVKISRALNELLARPPHVARHSIAHRLLDGPRDSRQSFIRRQRQRLYPVAFEECPVLSRRRVRQHRDYFARTQTVLRAGCNVSNSRFKKILFLQATFAVLARCSSAMACSGPGHRETQRHRWHRQSCLCGLVSLFQMKSNWDTRALCP